MIKRVNVIATFSQDGQIRPLWLKLQPIQEAPTYKILDCVCMHSSWGGRMIFRCLINSHEKDIEIRLEYNFSSHHWDLIINNSSEI